MQLRGPKWMVALAALVSLSAALAWLAWPEPEAPVAQAKRPVFGDFVTAAEGFPAPPVHWELRFPADHASHPDQFGEYWLFAARLADAEQRVLGVQLVFYRVALSPEPVQSESQWATRQIHRAQLLVELPHSGTAVAEERFSREALGLAGAQGHRVWVEDWSMRFEPECGCFELQAASADVRLQLTLRPPARAPVPLAGVAGLDAEMPGSHGYWWPGWEARGRVEQLGRSYEVTGQALVEQVWGQRLPLAQGQLTTNRLWLEIADGSALRCLQLRRRSGGTRATRALGDCLLAPPQGTPRELSARGVTPSASFTDGYPLDWKLDWPEIPLALRVVPVQRHPAPDFTVPLWGGLVQGDGERSGQPLTAWGWLEISGY